MFRPASFPGPVNRPSRSKTRIAAGYLSMICRPDPNGPLPHCARRAAQRLTPGSTRCADGPPRICQGTPQSAGPRYPVAGRNSLMRTPGTPCRHHRLWRRRQAASGKGAFAPRDWRNSHRATRHPRGTWAARFATTVTDRLATRSRGCVWTRPDRELPNDRMRGISGHCRRMCRERWPGRTPRRGPMTARARCRWAAEKTR